MDSEEVLAECSDEEEYDQLGTNMENDSDWGLKVEDLVELYQKITVNKMVEFSWKCPGRKVPEEEKPLDEVKSDATDKKKVRPPRPRANAETKKLINSQMFDEEMSQLTLRPKSGKSKPRGSGRKKTSSFASVLSNMERHNVIQLPPAHARSLLQPDDISTPTKENNEVSTQQFSE